MGSQGFKNIAGNPFVYQEDTRSAAFGLDAAAQTWKISIKATAGALPTDTAQLTIDPAANGNVTIDPNGSGNLVVTSGNVSLTAGNLSLPTTTSTVGQVTINSNRFIHNFGTANNTFVGSLSGNLTNTGSRLTALGASSLQNITSATDVIALGYSSGSGYVGAETYDIVIGATGTAAETGKIRIGDTTSSNSYSLSVSPTTSLDFGDTTTGAAWTTLLGTTYLAVTGYDGTSDIKVYSFNGTTLSSVATADAGSGKYAVYTSWTDLGGTKYLAVASDNSATNISIYSFNGSSLTPITTATVGPWADNVEWFTIGATQYLAVGANSDTNVAGVYIYSFNGAALTLIDSKVFGSTFGRVFALHAKLISGTTYIAAGGTTELNTELCVYSFNGSALTLIYGVDYGSAVTDLRWHDTNSWLAVTGNNGSTDAQVFSWNGAILTNLASLDFGTSAGGIRWLVDGTTSLLAVGGANTPNSLGLYNFTGSAITPITTRDTGIGGTCVCWGTYGGQNYIMAGISAATTNVFVYQLIITATYASNYTGAYIAGTYGASVEATNQLMIVDQLGKLGSIASTTVPYGGTGITSIAQGDLLYGSATNTLSALAKDTNATRYLSNTGTSNNPAWAQVNLTNGVTGILPQSNGGSMPWTEVTGTTQSAAVDNGYITNNGALVTVTLPATAAVGQRVSIVGKGAGLWKLAQNASQVIHFGTLDTTTGTGGYLSATERYDCLEAICVTANTDWVIRSVQGVLTVV